MAVVHIRLSSARQERKIFLLEYALISIQSILSKHGNVGMQWQKYVKAII